MDTLCVELGLTRTSEWTIAQMFVSSMRAYYQCEQLEAGHFADGYSSHQDLIRLNAVADLKAKHRRAAFDAYRMLTALKAPQIAIVANQAQINLSGRRRP